MANIVTLVNTGFCSVMFPCLTVTITAKSWKAIILHKITRIAQNCNVSPGDALKHDYRPPNQLINFTSPKTKDTADVVHTF